MSRSSQRPFYFGAVAVVLLALAACAPTPPAEDDYGIYEYDPLEPVNRVFHRFNYAVDSVVLKPVTMIYRGIVPVYGRERVGYFLANLSSPMVVANSVLQGDPQNAFTAFWRFVLNSTFGIGGLYDFAGNYAGLPRRDEDFGQTMGRWGVPQGAYLELPLIGPSSVRDGIGRAVDWISDPLNYYSNSWEFNWSRTGAEVIDSRDRNFKILNKIYQESVDPYAMMRTLYLQNRDAAVKNETGQ